MKNILRLFSIQFIILSFITLCYSQENNYRVLHHFTGAAGDGSTPSGTLVQSGTTLYGMTQQGGDNSLGTIFRIGIDGTNFGLLYSFDDPNGSLPCGSLVQSGSSFYGMTLFGGIYSNGTIFGIDTSGTNFRTLYAFIGGSDDGFYPSASPILSGSILFGNTQLGGVDTNGVIYKINADGTGYEILHVFGHTADEGRRPIASFVKSGSVLYGTTFTGGIDNKGTIFKINTDGTNFQLMHSFRDSIDGSLLGGSLILSGTTLYGTAANGGNDENGTIFRISTDGTDFRVIYRFSGGINDGAEPSRTSLIKSGSYLYGTTDIGGLQNQGIIFQIDTTGSGFRILHRFGGMQSDGSNPTGSLFLSGNTLYGMTFRGGNQGKGVIFALDISQPEDVHEKNSSNVQNKFRLEQNYPNPFNPTTNIQYSLNQSSNVKLTVYNLLSQKIKTLINSFQNQGEHSVVWNGTDDNNHIVSSGIYFYRLETNEINLQKKMILLQ